MATQTHKADFYDETSKASPCCQARRRGFSSVLAAPKRGFTLILQTGRNSPPSGPRSFTGGFKKLFQGFFPPIWRVRNGWDFH